MERLMTKADMAAVLQVHPKTVAEWVREGVLPHRIVGKRVRFDDRDLREYLDRNRRPAC